MHLLVEFKHLKVPGLDSKTLDARDMRKAFRVAHQRVRQLAPGAGGLRKQYLYNEALVCLGKVFWLDFALPTVHLPFHLCVRSDLSS